MTQEQFDTAITAQMQYCIDLLMAKGVEYAHRTAGLPEKDRLAHFKKAAALLGQSQEQALMGMLSKHLVSLSDMCFDEFLYYPKEVWQEKITDSINYLLILRAMLEEDAYEKN